MERDGLFRSSLFHCRIRLICSPKVIHFPGLHAQRSGQEAINWSLPPRDNGTARDSLFSVDGKVGPATKEKLWKYAGVYLNNEGIALNESNHKRDCLNYSPWRFETGPLLFFQLVARF